MKRISVWMSSEQAGRVREAAALIGAKPATIVSMALVESKRRGECPPPLERADGELRARYHIPDALYAWVRACAQAMETSEAAVVRGAVAAYLDETAWVPAGEAEPMEAVAATA